MTELPKTFDPAEIEKRWYAHWEETGQFHPDRPGAEPWTIVNPPPNVTGSLHIGHALDNTLQDVLVRHARMQGKDALWVVGTDHAGIATQMVVERQLALSQQKRTDFSRDEFVTKVWEWKEESGGEITQQLRRLGCSMDWANERFTMDEGFSKAVLKVFVDLYNQGLIYRDKRLVNWDPGLGTAISDLEVENQDTWGGFWTFKYPLADRTDFIHVATTRPETMLADMAIAVHPDDDRYKAMIGKQVRLPITGRLIPIIADEHADPELGSGAVKITPGHDFNDFEVGRRAGIEARDMLNMLDAKARVTQTADGLVPDEYIGLDRFDARKVISQRLEDEGLLSSYMDARPMVIPRGDRSGEVIEPWLTDQWYVDAATLAKGPIEAVQSGAIKIVPKSWEKTFFNWMENIQPWCVSRQLWWGHRIPAWFGPKKVGDDKLVEDPNDLAGREVFVAATEDEAVALARQYYGGEWAVVTSDADPWQALPGMSHESTYGPGAQKVVELNRDPDVLDTWFSSALWPFATMGWPDDADPTLHGRYPNDVLISGFDILFFWDARMMMQGMHFMGDVPFRTLYLHGLVRAADGQKMSKSKGNVVNPLGLIDRYGADALRFFMAAMESQGRDIKMDEKRVEGYRNFATKLWNAARFCQANGIGASTTLEPPAAKLAVNKWIIGETIRTVQAVDLALADYRFDGAANAIYQFAWSRFCDWYLELIKPVLQGGETSPVRAEPVEAPSFSSEESAGLRQAQAERGEVEETKTVAGWVLDQIFVLLHPFMPFVTEELWSKLGRRDYDLIVAKWPMADARAIDPEAEREIDWLIRLVSEIRAARTELNVPPSTKLAMIVHGHGSAVETRLTRNGSAIERLARINSIESFGSSMGLMHYRDTGTFEPFEQWQAAQGGSIQLVVDDSTFVIPLGDSIDVEAERARLTKAIEAAAKERDSLANRLDNPSFVERAKPEAVEKTRADHAEKSAEADRLAAALARLG